MTLAENQAGTLSEEAATMPWVHVVDDEESIQSLFQIFGPIGGFEVKSYRTAAEFLGREDDDHVGCVVLDLMLPDGTGIDVMQQMVAREDHLPVVFMSGVASVSHAVAAQKLGSLDFVEKPFEAGAMIAAVQRATEIDRQRRHWVKDRAELEKCFARLSARETEVMDLVVQGWANKDVAARLDLSAKTVEVHRANVMRKTTADSLAQLVRMHVALRGRGDGITTPKRNR